MLIDDIRQGESAELELKRVPNEQSERWLKTVVAFANCKGGRIVFGATDARDVIGLTGDLYALRDAIVDRIADACSPMPDVAVDIVNVEGREVLELSVTQGRQCPYFLRPQGDTDGVYVRYDATTRKADPATLQELRLDGAGKGYDSVVCRGLKIVDADVRALCARLYAEAVENAPAGADRSLVKPVTVRQLVKWGVLIQRARENVPSNAYALLTGDDRLATTVKCALFKGADRAVFLDRHPIDGSVIDQVNESFKWVLSKLNLSARFDGLKRVDVYEIPPEAIRELIVNAVVHRTYVDGASSPISIALYDDRLEITSPGGLPRGMTVSKMLAGHSECRNKALAAVFAYMFLIENWGSGLLRVQRALREAGLPPLEVQDFGNSIRLVVKRGHANHVGDNKGDNRGDNPLLSLPDEQRRICDILKGNPKISIRKMAEMLGIRKNTLDKQLSALKAKGFIERRNGTRGSWQVILSPRA